MKPRRMRHVSVVRHRIAQPHSIERIKTAHPTTHEHVARRYVANNSVAPPELKKLAPTATWDLRPRLHSAAPLGPSEVAVL